jgi:hypothetical protein
MFPTCRKCGARKGAHSVFSYNCPSATGFDPKQKFELLVNKLSMDADGARGLQGRGLDIVEQEIARRVLKNVEAALGTFDLSAPALNRESLIDALALVKKGYGI